MANRYNRGKRKAREFAYSAMRILGYSNPSYMHVSSTYVNSASVVDQHEHVHTHYVFNFGFVIDEQTENERECDVEVIMIRHSTFSQKASVRVQISTITWEVISISFRDPGPANADQAEWPRESTFRPYPDASEFAVTRTSSLTA